MDRMTTYRFNRTNDPRQEAVTMLLNYPTRSRWSLYREPPEDDEAARREAEEREYDEADRIYEERREWEALPDIPDPPIIEGCAEAVRKLENLKEAV